MNNSLSISGALMASLIDLLHTIDEDSTDGPLPLGYLPSTIRGSYYDNEQKTSRCT